MANVIIKAGAIVQAANLLLQREIVLPRLVWTRPEADFFGRLDDTVTLRVPAVLDSRTRTMRSESGLQADNLTETSVPVKLDTHVYSLLNIRDEELTLDIRDFAAQVLAPQTRAVVEGLEDAVAGALNGASWDADDIAINEQDPFSSAIEANVELNKLNVPRSERVLLVGANVEGVFLTSDKLSKVNEAGTSDALREATIARVAGFTVVGSNAIDPDVAYAFHRTAVAMGIVAPQVPAGAAAGARISSESLALRYVRDYNPTDSDGPVDRSLVDSFVGVASVEEGPAQSKVNRRGVKLTLGSS